MILKIWYSEMPEEVGQGVTWHAVILQNCVHLRFDLRRGNIDLRTDRISNWYNMDALEVQNAKVDFWRTWDTI